MKTNYIIEKVIEHDITVSYTERQMSGHGNLEENKKILTYKSIRLSTRIQESRTMLNLKFKKNLYKYFNILPNLRCK